MAFDAVKIWSSIPKEHQRAILESVFCVQCMTTTKIVDYSMEMVRYDVVLKGKCTKCGEPASRLVENPS